MEYQIKLQGKLISTPIIHELHARIYNSFVEITWEKQIKNAPCGSCHWAIDVDRTHIKWDGCTEFKNYIEWLQYIIDHFMKEDGYTLNGTISCKGVRLNNEEIVIVKNNEIILKKGE